MGGAPERVSQQAIAASKTFVRIRAVEKTYRTRERELTALAGVSLDIAEGELVSIVGPSGCGKSTLMMLVAGLFPASAGEISIGEQRVSRPYTDVGIVFQRDALLEWRTVLDNVLLQIDVRRL